MPVIRWGQPLAMSKARGPRDAAARVLTAVEQGRSLSAVLPEALATLAPTDRALAQELCYGTLRWYPRLEGFLTALVERPLKPKELEVKHLLLVGLYQLAYTHVAPHAAVSETVAATGTLNKPWAKGLVNAVLRRYQRERSAIEARFADDPVIIYAHPKWLLDRLRQDWPAQWQAIAEANNSRPPMTVRVNRQRAGRGTYLETLGAAGLQARPHPHLPEALLLAQPCPVEALPGFAEGVVSVQDAAAQLAAELLAPRAGEYILDACAAPGGKTAHLLEHCPEAEVVAIDREPDRLGRVHENLQRLGLSARVVAADAGDPSSWWDGRRFDRILLDAPCSATGVIRRHPDIKRLRRAEDIAALSAEQSRLLHALWPLLKPGGILLYATCSVLRDENERQISAFLHAHPDGQEEPFEAAWGITAEVGRQILPGQDDMDGFFYARLRKIG